MIYISMSFNLNFSELQLYYFERHKNANYSTTLFINVKLLPDLKILIDIEPTPHFTQLPYQ